MVVVSRYCKLWFLIKFIINRAMVFVVVEIDFDCLLKKVVNIVMVKEV